MPDREALIHALTQLDPSALEDVVNAAYRRRNDAPATPADPDPGSTPEQFAHWLARRHLDANAAIERVVYLPTGSPADEIRLLEVNRFLDAPDSDPIEPLDFTPDDDPRFRVFVADVAADRWGRIQQTPGAILPPGWRLEAHRVITRG